MNSEQAAEHFKNELQNALAACQNELKKRQIVTGPLLGCGTYGCVYQTSDPNYVLKLTVQQREYFAAFSIMAGDLDHNALPLIEECWEVECFKPQFWTAKRKLEQVPLYAIVRENLADVRWNDLSRTDEITATLEELLVEKAVLDSSSLPLLLESTVNSQLRTLPGSKKDDHFIFQILDLAIYLLGRNAIITDIQAGNWGIRGVSELVIRDVGGIRLNE